MKDLPPPPPVPDDRDDRPEFVHCVKLGYGERVKPSELQFLTWCGSRTQGFRFVNADHAMINARDKGRMLICQHCAKAMREALDAGTWDGVEGLAETAAEKAAESGDA